MREARAGKLYCRRRGGGGSGSEISKHQAIDYYSAEIAR